jgi:hypothetical protein
VKKSPSVRQKRELSRDIRSSAGDPAAPPRNLIRRRPMTKKNNKQKPHDPVDDYFYAAGVLIWLVLMVWGLS